MISLYQAHKNDGFTIVGVSIDSDQEAWPAAIDKDQLPWENLIDKGKWTSNVAQQYEINSIPDNILIDSNGVIIRRDIRVGELQTYLEERAGTISR